MVSILLDICKNFVDFIQKNREIKQEKKDKISLFFEDISNILIDTASKLKIDQYPHGNCIVLERLSLSMNQELVGIIPDEDLKHLCESLIEASNIEKLFAVRRELNTIPELERVSGEFKAMSMLMKLI